MKRILLAIRLMTGCRHYDSCCHKPANPVKWSTEGSLGTSLYPNAPCDKHEYFVEKVDVGIKIRREW